MDTSIRPACPADLETFVAHRCAMFRDMAYGDEAGLARMEPERADDEGTVGVDPDLKTEHPRREPGG